MPNEITPLINGKTYGWGDLSVNMNGLPVVGITAIKYGEAQAKANVYGAGRNPVARSSGRVSPTASVTLMVETVMAIAAKAPGGQLHRVAPFPIVVMYQPEAGPVVKDIIHNCEFKDQMRDWKEGDMHKEVTLELLVSHIQWDKK